MSEKEQEQLVKISLETSLSATLLPIKTVGVQVSVQAFFSSPEQGELLRLIFVHLLSHWSKVKIISHGCFP